MQLQSFIQPAVGGRAVVTAFYGESAPDGAVFPWSTAPLGSLYFQLDNDTPTVVIWQRKGTTNTAADWEAFSAATTVEVAHAAVTLGSGSDAALTLSGQELTLADVLTPNEHTAIGDGSPHHAAVTLDTNADTLLSLSTQQLGLDTQVANRVLAGPGSGAAAAPTFRALTSDDVPSLDHGAKLTGLGDDDHTQYLLATGTRAGASSQAQTFTNGLIINEDGNDSDTRIEGNGEANLFFVDAGNDRIGIGTASPGYRFSLVETTTDTATTDHYLVDDVYTVAVASDSSGSYSALRFKTVINSTADKYIANAIGSQGLVALYSGTPDNIFGYNGEIDVFGGTTFNAGSLVAKLVTFGGTTATWSGVRVLTPENYGGTLTTVIGLNVENITGATNNYAIRTNTGLIVFNEGGNADSDVRIEGDTDVNLLFTDAGNDRIGIGTDAPTVKLDVRGGIALPTKTIAVGDSPYTVLITDYTIRCNCAGGAITVALPEATGSGRILNIKKTDSSANAATVDGYSTNTIDGAATVDIGTQYANMQIQDAAAGVWDIL